VPPPIIEYTSQGCKQHISQVFSRFSAAPAAAAAAGQRVNTRLYTNDVTKHMRACVRALIPRQPLTQNTSEPLILKYRDTDEVLVFVKIILRAERHELRVSPVYRPASRLSVEDRRRMRSEKALRTLNGSSFHRADGAGTHRPKHAQSKSTLSAA